MRCLFLLIMAGCVAAPSSAPQQRMVLDSVHVVDVVRGTVASNQAIHIEDGVIRRITPAGQPLPENTHRIAAPGQFAIPGLIDAHVHLLDPQIEGRLLLANGVTMVRDMGSDLEQTLAFRHAVLVGRQVGPRVVIAAMVDGEESWAPFAISIATPTEAAAVVERLKERGVEQIKVSDRSITLETYHALAREARRHDMPLVGHVPYGLEEALAVQQASVEHLRGVAQAVWPKAHVFAANDSKADAFTFMFGPWHMYLDLEPATRRQRLAAQAKGGVVHVPTLVFTEGVAWVGREDMWTAPLLRYVRGHRPAAWAWWDNGPFREVAEAADRHVPTLHQAVQDLYAAGVTIVAGTDYGGPFNVAGFSLHRELERLAEAGLHPADVLRSATSHAAELFGAGTRLGLLKEGYEASVVLLEANPLGDIRQTRNIFAVLHAGRYYDRRALDELLAQAEALARAPKP